MDKKRILWVSDLVTPTGFSRVAHSIIKYITDEFDIVGVGINYNGDPHVYDFPIFPAAAGGALYGENRILDLLKTQHFDMMFILNDSWVISRYMNLIKKNVEKEKIPPIVVYFPVDSDYHDGDWYNEFDIVTKAVTYTDFGYKVVKDCSPDLELLKIPHGVDSDIFYKKYDKIKDAKKVVFGKTFEEDYLDSSFVVLNANRNQPRKKLDVTMRGFALFAKNKPENVKLYMHCGVVDASMNIVKLSLRYGIDNRLIVTSVNRGVQRVSESRLNEIYNACDVGINTSMGEGWGLCNVEHAVTGAVQLVPDHSACKELFDGCGWLIPAKQEITFDNSMTVGKLVTAEDVAASLEYLYQNKEYREELAKKGYEKFTSDKYNWKTISETWRELFREVTNNDVATISK